MPEGAQTTSPKACRRCPECGHYAASDKPARTGFWHDPTRWMVAVFAALLIGLQFSTVWLLPNWMWQNIGATAYEVMNDYYASNEFISWEDMSRAAKQPGRDRDRLTDALRRWESWYRIEECDPAASIIVADGWISSAKSIDLRTATYEFGFPRAWIQFQEMDEEPPSHFWLSDALWFSWKSSANPVIWMHCRPWPVGLALTTAQVFMLLWLMARTCRPVRAGFLGHPLTRHWHRIAAAVSLTLAFLPPLPMTSAYDRVIGHSLDWDDKPGYTADSGLRLEDIQDAATSDASAAAFARRLLDAHATLARNEQQWVNTAGPLVVARLEQKTRFTGTVCNFGWPCVFLTVTALTNGTPAGVAPTPGSFKCDSFSCRSIDCTFNAGAWPGHVISVHFSLYELLPSAMLTIMLCWLLRALLRTRSFFRGRKRAAAGRCTHCGYDLKGLRPTAST